MNTISIKPLPSAWERLHAWLRDPASVRRLWFGSPGVIVAWLGLLLAIVSSPKGVGVSLCWTHSITGIQCLGCGMTRSLSCALRGLFAESWAYHPFGIPLLLLFLATAAQSLLPRPHRERIRSRLEAHATFCNAFYVVFVALFISYGAVRALAQIIH